MVSFLGTCYIITLTMPPQNPTSRPQQPSPSPSIPKIAARATRAWREGRIDQAVLLCQTALRHDPDQRQCLGLLGAIAHELGNLSLAETCLGRLCRPADTPAPFLINLATLYREMGRMEDAERAARRAMSQNPALPSVLNNLGIILQEQGKLEESLACLSRLVALDPGSARAHNNLGTTFKHLWRLDEARRCYETAISLSPDYPEALSNLGSLLHQLGEERRGQDLLLRATAANPDLGDAHINLAALESDRGHPVEALAHLESWLSRHPDHVAGLTAKTRVLLHLGRPEEAWATIRQALGHCPTPTAETQLAFALTLQGLGRNDEALDAFSHAMALPCAGRNPAEMGRGILLMELGRREEALQAFRDMVARHPAWTGAWFHIADMKTFRPGDAEIARMEDLLAQDGVIALADRIALHFALGKAWMDCGDADRAFANLGEGNRLKRATFRYDGAAENRHMATIARVFSAERLQHPIPGAPMSERPIFIVGMPRSGTTLIEQILASHPDVAGAGELLVLPNAIDAHPWSGNGFPEGLDALPSQALAEMGQAYLDATEIWGPGKPRIIDKLPINFQHVGLIRLILPNARIVHCRRDAMDTCLSCYTKLFEGEQMFAYAQTELGQFFRGYDSLMAHWHEVVPPERLLDVRYEDVIDDLEGQARRLIAFCGLSWAPACLDYHRTPRQVRTASATQVRRPIYRDSLARWKPYAAHLAPLLQALGIKPVF